MTDHLKTTKPLAIPSRDSREIGRRILIYGPNGIGKTTFASCAPKPIFIPVEDGLAGLNVTAFPAPENIGVINELIASLRDCTHDFKTVVIDSLERVEELIFDAVCEHHGKDSIEDFGFGKGQQYALEHWRGLLANLQLLRMDRGMHIILIAHSKIERVTSPESDAYDRFSPRISKWACPLVCEWVDDVLFATQNFVTKNRSDKDRSGGAIAVPVGERVIRLWGGMPGYLAKTRIRSNVPKEIDLSWSDYESLLIN